MSDALMTGRRFRTFNVVDDHNREVLATHNLFNLQKLSSRQTPKLACNDNF
jgi:hypothetical protein